MPTSNQKIVRIHNEVEKATLSKAQKKFNDLRAWPRVRLDLLPNVRAFCHEKEVQVIDLAAGGAHVILRCDESDVSEIGTILQMKFVFDKGEVSVEGEILRKWKDTSQRDHIAIKFCGNNDIQKFIY